MLSKLPSAIRLTDGGAYLDGGTLSFDAISDAGEHVKIRLNQHMLDGTRNPGRLVYNGKIVDVRSEFESLLLSLLEAAEIEIEQGPHPDTTHNYIGPPVEIIKAENKEKIRCINEFRSLLIDFVRSERYIECSKNGRQS